MYHNPHDEYFCSSYRHYSRSCTCHYIRVSVIEVVKRHTEFSEFSAGLLNEFVERVLVHEAVSVDGVRTQDIEIFFSFVGKLALPELVSGKPQEAMATQIPIKPQNDTGAADNEAMPKSENAAVSSQNGENKMPGTVNSAAQPKTAQSGAPAGTISNSS